MINRGTIILIALLVFSCGGSKDGHVIPDYRVCKYLDWYTLKSTGERAEGVSCWEGNLLMLNGEAWTPAISNCTGNNVLDPKNHYFEKFEGDKCPREKVIAECHAGNSKLFIYEHEEVELNKKVFEKFCTNRLQGKHLFN